METVARHLQTEAMSRTVPIERDQFGRSAFNRYYYAAFLRVRAGLSGMRYEWRRLPHADMPLVLKGQIAQELKQGRQRAIKAQDADLVSLCGRALSAAIDLAKLLEEGKTTRVTADYSPEIAVDFTGGENFQLNTVAVNNARLWPGRAGAFIDSVSAAWRQLGV